MRVAVVVLNWNTKNYLRAFLPGIVDSCAAAGTAPDGSPIAGVVVADNGSDDGSPEMLEKEFPSVRTVLFKENYGFTGGYNRAFKALSSMGVLPEFYILINSDIEVEGDWISPLLDWMDAHPECGICGPKLHGLLEKDGKYVRSDSFEYAGAAGGLMDRLGFPYCRGRVGKKVETDYGQYDELSPEVLWVTGSCLMVRRRVWEEMDGLDDRFFAHMEEIDLCWRSQLAGWKVNVVADSTVWHLGGGTLPQNSPFKLKLNFRNNLLMLEGNLEKTYAAAGSSPRKARRKARFLIATRYFLDICAGIAYFCIGEWNYSKAVRSAHREWKQLRKNAPRRPAPKPGANVSGITEESVLFKRTLI